MLKQRIMAKITDKELCAKDVVSMWVRVGDVAGAARPGQFVALYCKDGARLLPRPISICEVDGARGRFRLVFRIVGKGTEELAGYGVGNEVPLMGPLGNGFPLDADVKRVMLIGGGIGIPPLVELSKALADRGHRDQAIVLGYRDEVFLKGDFEKYGNVYTSTEDGKEGTKGTVLDAILDNDLGADVIYACGPLPMLRGVKAYAEREGIAAWLSMEEHMACGIGACLACTCKSEEIDDHSGVKNKRVCKDGPVFLSTEVRI